MSRELYSRKLAGKRVTLRCRQCQADIKIDATNPENPVPISSRPPPLVAKPPPKPPRRGDTKRELVALSPGLLPKTNSKSQSEESVSPSRSKILAALNVPPIPKKPEPAKPAIKAKQDEDLSWSEAPEARDSAPSVPPLGALTVPKPPHAPKSKDEFLTNLRAETTNALFSLPAEPATPPLPDAVKKPRTTQLGLGTPRVAPVEQPSLKNPPPLPGLPPARGRIATLPLFDSPPVSEPTPESIDAEPLSEPPDIPEDSGDTPTRVRAAPVIGTPMPVAKPPAATGTPLPSPKAPAVGTPLPSPKPPTATSTPLAPPKLPTTSAETQLVAPELPLADFEPTQVDAPPPSTAAPRTRKQVFMPVSGDDVAPSVPAKQKSQLRWVFGLALSFAAGASLMFFMFGRDRAVPEPARVEEPAAGRTETEKSEPVVPKATTAPQAEAPETKEAAATVAAEPEPKPATPAAPETQPRAQEPKSSVEFAPSTQASKSGNTSQSVARPDTNSAPEQPVTKPTSTVDKPSSAPLPVPKPSVPAGEFDRQAAATALTNAASEASACRKPGDPSGMARVIVTFASSGRVTSANVNGPPFAGTATGGCIAATMRRARIPAFDGDNITVNKTVVIN